MRECDEVSGRRHCGREQQHCPLSTSSGSEWVQDKSVEGAPLACVSHVARDPKCLCGHASAARSATMLGILTARAQEQTSPRPAKSWAGPSDEICHPSSSTTRFPNSDVDICRSVKVDDVRSTADRQSWAAASNPRWPSIIAIERMAAAGSAMPRPAMSGADPWMASKRLGALPSRLRLALAAVPRPPCTAAPRSEMMSPNGLSVTMRSTHSKAVDALEGRRPGSRLLGERRSVVSCPASVHLGHGR